MASHTMVVAPIISALVEAEKMLGKKQNWQTENLQQVKFINDFFSKRNELSLFKPEELRSWVSDNADELNSVLVKEGFAFKVKEFLPHKLGIVSIINILIEWLTKGAEETIKHSNKTYPAILMKNEAMAESQSLPIFETYVSSVHEHPVFCANTKTGERVFMTVAEKEVAAFSLVFVIEKIRKRRASRGCCDHLLVPMIDYGEVNEILWLTGLANTDKQGQKWEISEALQQTKFKMNCRGMHIKSMAMTPIRVTSNLSPKIYEIDQPFLLWVERRGLDIPIIYAYLDETSWKNPGDI